MASSDCRHRRSIRLPGWDYATPGAYFVTICIQGRECILGEVRDGVMIASPYGQVVEECWRRLPQFFPHIELDAFVVMPNHVHCIVVIKGEAEQEGEASGCESAPSLRAVSPDASPLHGDTDVVAHVEGPAHGTQAGSLGAVVQSFKSLTARRINRMCRTPGVQVWQVNYYEHIVRDQQELDALREYIVTNPERWDEDDENPFSRT